MARASRPSPRVPRGRAHSNTSRNSLIANNQPSASVAYSKRQRRQDYYRRRHRRLAFAAQRKRQLEWADVARDTLRIISGEGKYGVQTIAARCPPPSPFKCTMFTSSLQGDALSKEVTAFYDVAPQILISQQGTTFYPHCLSDLANWRACRASPPTSNSSTIRFVSSSSLTAARHLIAASPRSITQQPNSLPTSSVGVLSFASPKRPGGGFLHGGNEQEEALARSTSLVASLRSTQAREFYRTHRKFLDADGAGLHDHSMVYSPGVVVFRRDDDDDVGADPSLCGSKSGSTIPPYLINIVSSVPVNAAAIRQNYLITSSDAHVFEEGIRRTMRNRMARVLRIFEMRGNRILVLGAFGCGSSENNIEMVAELWAELLVCGTREGAKAGKEEMRPAQFKGLFQEIVFAVPGKFFAPFKHAFEMKVLEMEVISATSE